MSDQETIQLEAQLSIFQEARTHQCISKIRKKILYLSTLWWDLALNCLVECQCHLYFNNRQGKSHWVYFINSVLVMKRVNRPYKKIKVQPLNAKFLNQFPQKMSSKYQDHTSPLVKVFSSTSMSCLQEGWPKIPPISPACSQNYSKRSSHITNKARQRQSKLKLFSSLQVRWCQHSCVRGQNSLKMSSKFSINRWGRSEDTTEC